jgi:hypothetical protein
VSTRKVKEAPQFKVPSLDTYDGLARGNAGSLEGESVSELRHGLRETTPQVLTDDLSPITAKSGLGIFSSEVRT